MSSDHDSRLAPSAEDRRGYPEETPGQLLARGREAQGLSRKAAADALNLPLRTLEALEADDYDKLPPLTFVKGYLRAYAQLLELDPEHLRDALKRLNLENAEPHAPRDTPVREAKGVGVERSPGRRPWLLGLSSVAVLVAVGVLAWLWLVDNGFSTGTPSQPTVAEPVEEVEGPEESAEVTPESSEMDVSDVPATEPGTLDDLAQEEGSDPAVSEEPEAAPEPDAPADTPVSVPELALDEEAAPAADDGEAENGQPAAQPEGALVLHISGNTWLEVRDASGDRLMVGNYSGDETHHLEGEAPYALVIGNAGQVRVEYDGESVDLGPHTRGNVARLTVP
ncbi:cytoskeleton protein RodZ [Alkalispirillum mobile]|uniref:Cytoskeleton protein RodZ n=1 Tax=Alkalispirillum mobile TaxID=85925 RepID=A0A498C5E5_9GAMM|nr:RodZ domain-containing protein [Alkalispirillum mobile]RLK50219.1 cytoskeleton protein RodZ [Alkalispirillum mobile]